MINSINGLFTSMDLQYRVFDLGRHIREIDSETFARVEDLLMPYPSAYLQHAWMGFVLWHHESPGTPLIWFVKLPLDEQGKLVAGDRDLFLKQLLIALGSNLNAIDSNQQMASVLEGNPYIFTPTPQRQASFNARIKQLLNIPPSQFYQATVDYLQSDLKNWQQLAMQGIADLTECWKDHAGELARAITKMPEQALIPFSQCLEDQVIDGSLGEKLSQRLGMEVGQQQPNPEIISALVRGLSQCTAIEIKQNALGRLLDCESAVTIEVLASIATRCALDLCNPDINKKFLEILSRQGPLAFNKILADVMFSPAIRQHILLAFQQPDLSDSLRGTIAGLKKTPQFH